MITPDAPASTVICAKAPLVAEPMLLFKLMVPLVPVTEADRFFAARLASLLTKPKLIEPLPTALRLALCLRVISLVKLIRPVAALEVMAKVPEPLDLPKITLGGVPAVEVCCMEPLAVIFPFKVRSPSF